MKGKARAKRCRLRVLPVPDDAEEEVKVDVMTR